MQCHTCHEEKPPTPEFFTVQASGRLSRWCKVCRKKYMADRYRALHPAKPKIETVKVPRPAEKQCIHCYVVKPFTNEFFHIVRRNPHGLASTCKDCTCKRVLKLKYKTDINKEGKSCELCGTTHRLVYDHNHRTGEARGIICQGCNSYLSAVENPAKRKAFMAYLIKYNSWLE